MNELPEPTGVLRPAPPIDDVDVAYGIPLGLEASGHRARQDKPSTPAAAMEAVLLRALQKPPCVVSFSGGRDSSALLALATHIARREGLAPPIPATLLFPGVELANEDSWQQTVLGHLGLTEWLRFPVADELDAVGPVATTALRRHGLLWPFNAHFHLPIIAAADGGSVVTGFGGDEIARSSEGARAERVLTRRRRWQWVDAFVIGLAAAPPQVRIAVQRHRALNTVGKLPWLTPQGRRAVVRGYGKLEGQVPFGWGRKLRRWIRYGRYYTVCKGSFQAMGDSYRCTIEHPFVDPIVLQALAAHGGFGGLGSRTDIMRLLVGELLPEAVLSRADKGSFSDPLWTKTSQEFARDWSPATISGDLVDPHRLKEHWLSDDRNILSTTLLQQAWVNSPDAWSPRY